MSKKLPTAFRGGRQNLKNKPKEANVPFSRLTKHLRRCVLGKQKLEQGEGQPGDWPGVAVGHGVVGRASVRMQCLSADWQEVTELMTWAAGGRGL